MKVKQLLLAVAVLGVAAAATWFLKRGGDDITVDPREGKTILDTGTIEKAAGIFVRMPTGDIELAKSEGAGGKWIVKSYHDLPADFGKISTLVEDLRKATVTRFASAQAERIGKMGFDGTRLELRDKEGKTLRAFQLGKNVESGGRFVKFDDETKAYVASVSAYLESSAKNWADTALVAVKPEDVLGVDLTFADGGTMHLKRVNSAALWTGEELAPGERFKDSEVSSLVSKLASLRYTETADPGADDVKAARENSRSFKITLATGKSYDIALGRKPAPPAPPPPAEKPEGEKTGDDAAKPGEVTPPAPEPGLVYGFVQSSDANEPVNELMKRRAFQINEWTFTNLPANRAAIVEAAPPPMPASDAPSVPPPAATAEPAAAPAP